MVLIHINYEFPKHLFIRLVFHIDQSYLFLQIIEQEIQLLLETLIISVFDDLELRMSNPSQLSTLVKISSLLQVVLKSTT